MTFWPHSSRHCSAFSCHPSNPYATFLHKRTRLLDPPTHSMKYRLHFIAAVFMACRQTFLHERTRFLDPPTHFMKYRLHFIGGVFKACRQMGQCLVSWIEMLGRQVASVSVVFVSTRCIATCELPNFRVPIMA